MAQRAVLIVLFVAAAVLSSAQRSWADSSSADSLWAAIDLSGIPVYGGAQGAQVEPSVAWGSSSYLAVWSDDREGSDAIFAVRVAGEGSVLDPAGIVVYAGYGDQRSPAVAFDGENWLVTWYDGESRLVGARVSQSGAVLDTTPLEFDTAWGSDRWLTRRPEIAFDGANYLIAYAKNECTWWDEYFNCMMWATTFYACFVAPNGVQGSPFYVGSPFSMDDYGQELVFGGSDYFLVWGDAEMSGHAVQGQLIASDGSLIGSEIEIASGTWWLDGVGAAHVDDAGYVVTWSDTREDDLDVMLAHLNDAGTVMSQSTIGHIAGEQTRPAICPVDSFYVVAWLDGRNAAAPTAYAARVDTAGTVLDTEGVPLFGGGDLTRSAVASDGDVSLVVWDDARVGNLQSDVKGARFDSGGVVLDPAAFFLAAGSNYERPVRVGFDGTNYLLVWEDGRGDAEPDIYCARVDGEGTVLDEDGVPVAAGAGSQTDPELSFDGSNYLVVWRDVPPGESDGDIRCSRVSPSGVVLDSLSIGVATTSAEESDPSVGFDGASHVVAWKSGGALKAARVTPSGSVLDPSGITVAASAGQGHHVAGSGAGSLVTYNFNFNIYAKRLNQSGVVLDATPILVSSGNTSDPAPEAAFADDAWLVGWRWYNSANSSYDIHAGRVTSEGSALDGGTGFAVSEAPGTQADPAVCFKGDDFLVAWSDGRSGEGYDVYCARVGTDGVLKDASGISVGELAGDQVAPSLAGGAIGEALLAYSSFDEDGRAYRIWGNRWAALWAGVDEAVSLARPVLYQNQPNPFNPRTTIRFTLPTDGRVSLDIYDAGGRRVRRLVDDEVLKSGAHSVEWSGGDEAGHWVASGVYFVRLSQMGASVEMRVVLVR